MLKLHYSRKTVEANIKDTIEELAGTFSRFDKFDEEAKRHYLENSYAPKLVGISSNLNELGIRPFQSAPENFDPRYVQEYLGKWTKKMDERAKINQSLIDFLEKYGITQTPEARFVLYNSLLYLDGKDVDEFKQRKAEMDEFKQRKTEVSRGWKARLKNFINLGRSTMSAPSLDTNASASGNKKGTGTPNGQTSYFGADALADLSEQPFDYLECPFDGSMDGFCSSSTFAKDDKKVYARFSREEFEEYMLMRTYDKLVMGLNGKDIGEALINDLRSVKIKGTYSDSAVERLEKRLGSSVAASPFLTSALKHAVRTKTKLSFDGKGRDYFLYGVGLIGDELRLGTVGDWAMAKSEHKLGKLDVGSAQNEFGKLAKFEADEVRLGRVGFCALTDSKNKIRTLKVEAAKAFFGEFACFETDSLSVGTETYALPGSSPRSRAMLLRRGCKDSCAFLGAKFLEKPKNRLEEVWEDLNWRLKKWGLKN